MDDTGLPPTPLTQTWWFLGLVYGGSMSVVMTLINVLINQRPLVPTFLGSLIWILAGVAIWGPVMARVLRRQREKEAIKQAETTQEVFK